MDNLLKITQEWGTVLNTVSMYQIQSPRVVCRDGFRKRLAKICKFGSGILNREACHRSLALKCVAEDPAYGKAFWATFPLTLIQQYSLI